MGGSDADFKRRKVKKKVWARLLNRRNLPRNQTSTSKQRSKFVPVLHLKIKSDKKLIEMYAGAQESLKPFIEYADNSIEAAKNQRNTLRFRWEEVKKPRNIVVRPNFTILVTHVEAFQYTTSSKNLQIGERLITDNDELNRILVGHVDEDGFTPFSTERPLDDFENWQRILFDGKVRLHQFNINTFYCFSG